MAARVGVSSVSSRHALCVLPQPCGRLVQLTCNSTDREPWIMKQAVLKFTRVVFVDNFVPLQ